MPRRSLFALVAALAAAGACERASPPPPQDTVARAEPQAAEPPPAWSGTWAPELGQILLVPSDTDHAAILVYPQSVPDVGSRITVDLLTAGGDVAARGVEIAGLDSLECGGAPVVRLSSATFGTWAIGVHGSVTVLRGDSVESLPSRDSARLVTNITRLASTIAADQETRFTGLPFSVAGARRYTVGNTRIVAAHLIRRLPQEASPLEEHTFLIAERTLQSDALVLRFSDRSQGTEENAEHFEVLAAVDTGDGILLLIARDTASRTRYELLERASSGTWRVRWARPLSC